MLQIFTVSHDRTTDIVLSYLRRARETRTIQRINSEVPVQKILIKISTSDSYVHLQSNDGSTVTWPTPPETLGWFRRGNLSFALPLEMADLHPRARNHLERELIYLREFLYDYSLCLGSHFKEIHNNRLSNILLAKSCGLDIPDTLVSSEKQSVINFKRNYENIVTKPIHNGYFSYTKDNDLFTCQGTVPLTDEFLEQLAPSFAPSLFQQYIEKEIEIRIFFLNGKLYPMAIFSQLDQQTRFDFRNYNRARPNRTVPYILPSNVNSKILSYIDQIGLTTGSIDLIMTPEHKYYFLEVNPTGQFGWLSRDCNYFLEREIADYIIKYET